MKLLPLLYNQTKTLQVVQGTIPYWYGVVYKYYKHVGKQNKPTCRTSDLNAYFIYNYKQHL